MNYAAIKDFDIANGPGIRVSLFVSGCPHHCKGCFNSETWDYDFGQEYGTVTDTNRIIELLKRKGISGLSILGGEPMDPYNVGIIADMIRMIRIALPDVNIWIYSGYTIEELVERCCNCYDVSLMVEALDIIGILQSANVLVDGRFVEEKKDMKLRFRGSSNQRIIDLKNTQIETCLPSMSAIKQLALADEYM